MMQSVHRLYWNKWYKTGMWQNGSLGNPLGAIFLISNRALWAVFLLGRDLRPIVSNALCYMGAMCKTLAPAFERLWNLLACFWFDLSALSLVLLLWCCNCVHIVSFLNKYRIEGKKGKESEVRCLFGCQKLTKKVMPDRPGAIKPSGDRVSIVSR